MSRERIDFNVVKVLSRPRLMDILHTVAPVGKFVAREYIALSPCRGDKSLGSFKFNIQSQMWSDFATGESGNDIISYVAYALTLSQYEATLRIQSMCGISTSNNIYMPRTDIMKTSPISDDGLDIDDEGEVWRIISPIPETAKISDIDIPLNKREIVSEYRNSAGKLIFVIIRESWNKGRPWTYWINEKTGKEKWRCRHIKTQRPLLNFKEITNNENKTIFLVEGEKSCIAAAKLFPDMVCSTFSGGSMSVAKTDFSPLRGKRVILFPDFDEPGHIAMEKVAQLAIEAGASTVKIFPMDVFKNYQICDGRVVKRINKYSLPQGFDAHDAINIGWTFDLIKEVVNL